MRDLLMAGFLFTGVFMRGEWTMEAPGDSRSTYLVSAGGVGGGRWLL
jgi:hypothetical protein